MKHVTIYKLQDDGSQKVLAICKLVGETVECEGNQIFINNLTEDGIRDYAELDPNTRLFPKDGAAFLEQLPNNFRSGYLMAEPEE